jgi:hypothetical protein
MASLPPQVEHAKSPPPIRTCVLLPASVRQLLEAQAARERRSMSQQVSYLIERAAS